MWGNCDYGGEFSKVVQRKGNLYEIAVKLMGHYSERRQYKPYIYIYIYKPYSIKSRSIVNNTQW